MARVIRNLAELRAQRALDAPALIAPDGREFVINPLTVDGYLTVLDLEQRFEALRGAEAAGRSVRELQTDLFAAAKEMILSVVPGFPVGDLALDELFMILGDVQRANTPASEGKEAANDGATGESS